MTESKGNSRLSRRQWLGASIGGGISGGLWATGMTILAQGRHPQIFVLGDDAWQIVLADDRSGRILFLVGEFSASPVSGIDHIMSAIRQRVDVLIGTGSSLAFLPPTFAKKRAVSHIIQVNEVEGLGSSPTFTPLVESLTVGAGPFTVALDRIPDRSWNPQDEARARWIGHMQCDGIRVAIAPGLDVIADHGFLDSALAIAPRGLPETVWSILPQAGVAVNGAAVQGWTPDEGAVTGDPRYLVRTFPLDVAAFPIREGRIGLPGWAQPVAQESRGS